MLLLTASLLILKHSIFHTLAAGCILLGEDSPLVCTQCLAVALTLVAPITTLFKVTCIMQCSFTVLVIGNAKTSTAPLDKKTTENLKLLNRYNKWFTINSWNVQVDCMLSPVIKLLVFYKFGTTHGISCITNEYSTNCGRATVFVLIAELSHRLLYPIAKLLNSSCRKAFMEFQCW